MAKEKEILTAAEAKRLTDEYAEMLQVSRGQVTSTVSAAFNKIKKAIVVGQYDTNFTIGTAEKKVVPRGTSPVHTEITDYKQALMLGYLVQRRLRDLGYQVEVAETKNQTLPVTMSIRWIRPEVTTAISDKES